MPGLRLVNPLKQKDWDRRLSSHPEAGFFHGSEWAAVLHETYGYTPVYLAAHDESRLFSLLPLMEVNSPLTGRRGVSLPFTDECEPLVSSDSEYPRLLQQAIAHGRERRWKYLELRGGARLMPEAQSSVGFFSHTLDLTRGERALFEQCESGVRRAVRKAESAGVRVEICRTLEAMRIFYGLHCRTRKKHGLPPQPLAFFLNIHRQVVSNGSGSLMLAWHGQRPIAAAVFLHRQKQAIYKFGASDEAWQQLRGNNLVMWEAIKHFCRQGFEVLHFGRTSKFHDGLRRFKLGWGTAERPLKYFKYDLRQDRFVAAGDPVAGWYNTLFRFLPIPMSRMAGKLLYRHMG